MAAPYVCVMDVCFAVRDGVRCVATCVAGRGGEMSASCRVSRVACGFERRSRRDAGEEMRVDSRLDRRRRRGARATDAPFRFVDAMGWDA